MSRLTLPPTRITAGEPSDDEWLAKLMQRPEPAPVQSADDALLNAAQSTQPAPEMDWLASLVSSAEPEQVAPRRDEAMKWLESAEEHPIVDGAYVQPGTHGTIDFSRGGGTVGELDPSQGGAAAQQRPPRQSREEMLLASLARPSGKDAALAALFDGLLGGSRYQDENRARRNTFEQARIGAQAADAGSAERAEENEYSRGIRREQMGLTQRQQDLADKRYEEDRALRQLLADQRIESQGNLQTQRDAAALERAKIAAKGRGGGGSVVPRTPEQREAHDTGVAAWLAQQANVPIAKAKAFIGGQSEGLSPEEAESLQVNLAQFQILPAKKQSETLAKGLSREGATPDSLAAAAARKQQDPEKRLEARNTLLAQHAAIKDASAAWRAMSPKAKQVMARVGGGDSMLASMARSGLLSAEEQAHAAKIQALANALIKAQSGASVTANEWRRVAKEIGLPEDGVSAFNSPASIESWLQKSVDAFRLVRKSNEATYSGLFEGMEQ